MEYTKETLSNAIESLGDIDETQKKKVVCSLIGHTLIQELCFGYYSCGRCGEQLGDTLASVYPTAEKTVIIGHACKTCEENYEKLTWKDKFMMPTKKEIFNKEL